MEYEVTMTSTVSRFFFLENCLRILTSIDGTKTSYYVENGAPTTPINSHPIVTLFLPMKVCHNTFNHNTYHLHLSVALLLCFVPSVEMLTRCILKPLRRRSQHEPCCTFLFGVINRLGKNMYRKSLCT